MKSEDLGGGGGLLLHLDRGHGVQVDGGGFSLDLDRGHGDGGEGGGLLLHLCQGRGYWGPPSPSPTRVHSLFALASADPPAQAVHH